MLRSAVEYVESLRDGRAVYYRGRRVDDVTKEPDLRVAIDHASIDFEMADDPDHRDALVVTDETGAANSLLYRIPRSPADLLARSAAIEATTARGRCIPPLIKEIGTDAMFALLRITDGESYERAETFYDHCHAGDLAVAVAQTDVKGNRALAPHQQGDPDLYLHVVSESADGIVVRGAKTHTSASANANEMVVLPTRAMGADDADFAIAFALPLETPGLSLYVSPFSAGERDPFEFPVSSRAKMLETLTVFDDVFVPWERVFLYKEPQLAGPLALAFVEYHRFTAVSYKLPLLDVFVGGALRIAEMNGVERAGHIRDKLTHLITFAETVRGLTELAALRGRAGNRDIWHPDPLTTNMAKFTFASGYHTAVEMVQNCAGGLLVTGPGAEDWAAEEIRPVLQRFYAAAAPAEDRLRLMHLLSDLTVRDFGGYHAVLAVHAEGSVEAEKMQILRSYDPTRSRGYVGKLGGLPE
jgi:4-hydroxybutyryl-CoA dehydratase / vinylacetyl-CoA-Delta-isomerase